MSERPDGVNQFIQSAKADDWFQFGADTRLNALAIVAYIEQLEARVAELEAEVQRRDDADNADYLDNLEHTEQ